MNNNEILRALECCGNGDFCNHCKYQDLKDCYRRLAKDTLDLINRQQIEIEVLQNDVSFLDKHNDELIADNDKLKAEIERLKG